MTAKISARTINEAQSNVASSGRDSRTPARTRSSTSSNDRSSGREKTLADLINAELSKHEADPHVIARRLLPKLTPEMREELVLVGLADRVSRRMATIRSDGVAVPPPTTGKSKWEIAQRVWVAGEHKFLADCDLSDLSALAEQHRDIAARNLHRAEEYEALADEVRAAGVATVGELWAAREKDLAA